MFKKIILSLSLLIFAHQEFYGMELNKNNLNEKKKEIWESIHNWVNCDRTNHKSHCPKLWLLWSILDNVPFQYGCSKIWKEGEAYYGLSNGIGFFPSTLNSEWLKIGIVDAHLNVINLILDYFKCFIYYKTSTKKELSVLLFAPFLVDLLCGIHIISIKILNCIKIKFITPIAILLEKFGLAVCKKKCSAAWYIKFDDNYYMSWWYVFLSPRIEINIAELINYFKNL